MTQFQIGSQMIDTLTGDVVTVTATWEWKGRLVVGVRNPNTPNPSNIPGLENYWVYSTNLKSL